MPTCKYHIKPILLFFLIVWVFFSSVSCNKSEKDEEYTRLIIGSWQSINYSDTTFYVFRKDNTGSSEKFGSVDPFSWEIKRGFIRTYYKKSPPYQIGEDKYNSKGVYRILSLDEKEASLEQHLYGGYVSNITLHVISE